jgi:hypothetical protein
MKRFAWIGVLGAAAFATGCISSQTLVTVKADGSGTIEQRTLMSTSAMNLIASMGGGEASADKLFDEESMQKTAARLGPGVRVVSNEPLEENGMKGTKAVFAFDDINAIHLSESPNVPGVPGEQAGAAKEPPMTLKFERGGATHVLTITLPRSDRKDATGTTPPPDAEKPNEAPPEALDMMRMMLKGLKVTLAVAVDGTIVKTNAQFHDDSRVTLVEMDFDELMKDDASLKAIQGKFGPGSSAADLQAALKTLKGVKINPDSTIRIEWR